MNLNEAMQVRHSVRKYMDKPLPDEIIEKLQVRISSNNDEYDLSVKLIQNDIKAFNAAIKLILTRGVKNYIILSGKDTLDLDEKLGLCGADLMLYAQTIGLNTWWVGETFNRKHTENLSDGSKVIGIIAVGYGATQGVPHNSKKPEEVSSYDGEAPDWFRNGVNASLFAPTARNLQAYHIKGQENRVQITCNNKNYAGVELGLLKYHFELGASSQNIKWIEKE